MAIDIFAPQISKISSGLEGKVIFEYGPNSVGKTYNAVRMDKPLVLACENGLNAQANVKHFVVPNWRTFTEIINGLTNAKNIEKAKEEYHTIIIDEVYASALFCQKYVCDTYGEGCISLGANPDSRVNLYQVYERLYWEQINKLANSGYTVLFIGHAAADPKTGYISPKGDKRMLNPIMDNSDFVLYLDPQGTDKDGNVIKSTAYTASTDRFFARSRFEHMPTAIREFTVEKLEAAINEAIAGETESSGVQAVSFEEKKVEDTKYVEKLDYDALMGEINTLCTSLVEQNKVAEIQSIADDVLGVGKKISECTPKQTEALADILDRLKEVVG
ncbi:MAG: AAA family ATPase [Lachnospiraceae bacterium]|nr:AAA family ATPase [Lachnospiraceae bacterium]